MDECGIATKSVDLRDLLKELPDDVESLKKTFDENRLKDVREGCIEGISRAGKDDVKDLLWLMEKVYAHLQINDGWTVLTILRNVSYHGGPLREAIVRLMADTVKSCLECPDNSYFLKEALVILCGKIIRKPEFYNETIGSVFQAVLEKFDNKELSYGKSYESFLLAKRVFRVIAAVRDRTFLPLIEKNTLEEGKIQKFLEISTQEDDKWIKYRIELEESRSFLIRYLKNI